MKPELTDIDGCRCLVHEKMVLKADFSEMLFRVRNGKWQHELLVKASGIKNIKGTPRAVDATAGLGEDALILAAAGFYVTLYEYNPVIAELLKDALKRAQKHPELSDMALRMEVVESDSISAMKNLKQVQLIYLDPMFPTRSKSGLIKKKFQLLQMLESPCVDEKALLSAALFANPKRVVIKRPLKGGFIAGMKPHFQYKGSTIRYDCFSQKG